MSENNPFVDGMLEWMDSPQGQLAMELSDVLWELLDGVTVDAKERKIVWTDGQRLSITESVEKIHREHSQYPTDLIENKLTGWLESGYVPEANTQEQLDELDELTEQWVRDYYNQRKSSNKG